MEQQKKSKFLKGALIIGMVIVINLFLNYTLSLIYPEPEYLTYCPNSQVIDSVNTQEECVAKGGQWNGNNIVPTRTLNGETKPVPAGYCDLNYTCNNSFQKANETYDRTVFIILVVIGAILLSVGVYAPLNSVISTGLSYAGVLSFLIASIRYWGSADNLIKVIILALALALLITVAYRKFKDQ